MTAEPTTAARPRRRWLQFSLRTLLLVMIPIACVVAWLGSEYRRGQRQHAAIAWVEEHGGTIEYDDQLTQANWRRRVFGEWFPESVVKIDMTPPPPSTGMGDMAPFIPTVVELESLSLLAELPTLVDVDLAYTKFESLAPLAKLENLQVLDLANTASQSRVPVPAGDRWELHDAPHDLSHLTELEHLLELDLSFATVEDFTPLGKLHQLETLGLAGAEIRDLSPLAGLTNLRSLDLSWTPCDDLAPLAELKQLEELTCWACPIDDLTPLANLHRMRALDLFETQITNIAPLAKLQELTELVIQGEVSNLTPLQGLTNLEWLQVYDTTATDFTPLTHLHKLKSLHITRAAIDYDGDLEELLQQALPDCHVNCGSKVIVIE